MLSIYILYHILRILSNISNNDIRDTWRDVRNFGQDVSIDLPEGVYGPFYNDRFDDVFG